MSLYRQFKPFWMALLGKIMTADTLL